MIISKKVVDSKTCLNISFDSSRLAPFEIQKIGEMVIMNSFVFDEHEIIDGRELLRRIAELNEYSFDEHMLIEDLFDRAMPVKQFFVRAVFATATGEITQELNVRCSYECDIVDELVTMTGVEPKQVCVLGATSVSTVGRIKYELSEAVTKALRA